MYFYLCIFHKNELKATQNNKRNIFKILGIGELFFAW